MGIQINGQTDIVTSTTVGGRVTIPTATFPSVSNINATGVSTFSGGIIVSSGSTAAPSISPSGDSNTGIFFPSPDTVAIGEGSTEVLRVDSNGRLGIGTNNPTTTLDVLSSATALKLSTATNNTHIQFRDTTNSNEGYLNFINNSLVYYRSGPVEAFKSDSSGNLTISNGNLVMGTAGKGIDFSATANSSGTMTSELLADYEEGTWTPTVNSGTVGSINRATYTKIGNRVWYQADFVLSGTRSGTQFQIGGLPFTVVTNGWSPGSTYAAVMNTDFRTMCSLPNASGGNSYLIIQVITTGGAGAAANGTDFGNGYFSVAGFYEAG